MSFPDFPPVQADAPFQTSVFSQLQLIDDDAPPPPPPAFTIYVGFYRFSNETGIKAFLADTSKVERALQKHTYQIVFLYQERPIPGELPIICISEQLADHLRKAGGGTGQLTESWPRQLLEAADGDLPFTARQISQAIADFIVLSPGSGGLMSGPYKGFLKELNGLVADPSDHQTQAAMQSLARLLSEMDADEISTYNQLEFVRYNSWAPKSVGAGTLLRMVHILTQVRDQSRALANGKMNTAEAVMAFANRLLVDDMNSKTKHLIIYPFRNLSIPRRIELIRLFLDGRDLDFSGYIRNFYFSEKLTSGDVVFNLLVNQSAPDLHQTFIELNGSKRKDLFRLFNAGDDEFRANIALLLQHVMLEDPAAKNNPLLGSELIAKGNFIHFDFSLRKKQSEDLDEERQQIRLENLGHSAGGIRATPLYEAQNQEYLKQYASSKTFFDPMELIVVTAEDDINSSLYHDENGKSITIEKGTSCIFPAAFVYMLFAEDTNRAKSFAFAVAAIALLPFSVASLAAAIEAGNTLGAIAISFDIAADAAYFTYSLPGVQNSTARDDYAGLNTAIALYGMARLSYSIKDVKVTQLHKRIKAAFVLIREKVLAFTKGFGRQSIEFVNHCLGAGAQAWVRDRLLYLYTRDSSLVAILDVRGMLMRMEIVTTLDNGALVGKSTTLKLRTSDRMSMDVLVEVRRKVDPARGLDTITIVSPFKEGQKIPGEIINRFYRRNGDLGPCMERSMAEDLFLAVRQRFYMVVEEGKTDYLGRWAADKAFLSSEQARSELALLDKFKPRSKDLYILEFEVMKPGRIAVRKSVAGPMVDQIGQRTVKLQGGAVQYEFFVDLNLLKRTEDFKQIDLPKRLP